MAAAKPTVYLICHGEKPAHDEVFGASCSYDIGYIMAQTPKADGTRSRPHDTVAPLAADLAIDINLSCDRDDEDCVKGVVDGYNGKGNILICWEHKELNNIAEALGAKNVPNYPANAFDLIWTLPAPYNNIVKVSSEDCPGLDE